MDYEMYRAYKTGGRTALGAFNFGKGVEAKMEARKAPMSALETLVNVVIGYVVVSALVKGILGYDGKGKLWITSPSGKTTKEVSLLTALRVIRKRKWEFTQVWPVTPIKLITRKDALKMLIFGGGMYKEMTARKQRGAA